MSEKEFRSLKIGDVIEWRHLEQRKARYIFLSFPRDASWAAPWAMYQKGTEWTATTISHFPENWHKLEDWDGAPYG